MSSFWHYLTWGYLWSGAWLTIQVSLGSLVGAIVLGAVLAEARMSRARLIRVVAASYTWVMRGTPLLLQLIFLFDALPSIGIVLKPIPTAIIGFSLNEAAFVSEIIRGGRAAVPRTQILAAESLGMSPGTTRRRVVLPQALRTIVPSLGNEFIALIKGTSLASVISVNELTARSEFISSQTFLYFPVYSAVGIMYLVLTTFVSGLQRSLERRFSLEREAPPVSLLRRLLAGGDGNAAVAPATAPSDEPAHAPLPVVVERAAAASVLHVVPARTCNRGEEDFVLCRAVWKRYGETDVLQGVDLSVRRSEVVAIMGGSGSGKSTLLRLINHLEPVTSGQIFVDGEPIGYDPRTFEPFRSQRRLARARAEAAIGMVFQGYNLFEHMTVLDNVVAASVLVHGEERDRVVARAMPLLDRVGMAAHAAKLPHRLSGGQQQRVAIARALCTEPKLMLFDEPTSALDPELVGEVLASMRQLANEGMTMLVVTHEVRFALEVADRIVFLSDGRIVEEGSPADLLQNPRAPQTRRFLQSIQAPPAV